MRPGDKLFGPPPEIKLVSIGAGDEREQLSGAVVISKSALSQIRLARDSLGLLVELSGSFFFRVSREPRPRWTSWFNVSATSWTAPVLKPTTV